MSKVVGSVDSQVERCDVFSRLNTVNHGDRTEKRDIPRQKRDLSSG